jgi:hypothetical protein
MKHKCPAELNSKVIRINLDTYRVIRGLSLRDNITIDEALTKLITGQSLKAPAAVRHIQRPMSVIMAEKLPVTAYQVKPQSVIATNGSKVAAFRIKLKGAKYA